MRLQLLMLPGPVDAPTPFVLVLDNVPANAVEGISRSFNIAAKNLGAVGGLVFSEQVEVL